MCDYWYHPDLSQAFAEQLLIRDGRDGAFVVRPSESVPGGFAICVLYKQQIHTYRVLREENGMYSVQSVQGVEVKRFPGLSELVSAYKNEHNGMVTSLQHPVTWDRYGSAVRINAEGSTFSGWNDIALTDPMAGSSHWDCSSFSHSTHPQEERNEAKRKSLGLCSLNPEIEMECKKLDRQIEVTLHSLMVLAQLFGQITSVQYPQDDHAFSMDKLIYKMLAVQDTLGVIERRAISMLQERVTTVHTSTNSHMFDCHKMETICPSKEGEIQRMTTDEKSRTRKSAPQKLSVFLGTWNMGNSPPPRSISSWLSCKGSGRTLDDTGKCVAHDIYAIGTQENLQADREWTEFLKAAVLSLTGKQYTVVSSQSLGGVKLVLVVKQEYKNLISHVQMSNVRTRISDTLGNRGAVGVSFDFNGTSFGFVTCHLVSGNEKIQKRNQSCGDILRSLTLGDEALRCFQLPLRLTYLFWMGDLNYRINMPVQHGPLNRGCFLPEQDVLQCVYRGQYQRLLPVDQLNQERERKKVFLGFREEPITFQPTSRYERGSRTYDLQKSKTTGTRIFAPCWSDRVLWTSYPDTDINCTSYGCMSYVWPGLECRPYYRHTLQVTNVHCQCLSLLQQRISYTQCSNWWECPKMKKHWQGARSLQQADLQCPFTDCTILQDCLHMVLRCTDDIVTSDHSPVFATFDLGLNNQAQKGLSCTLRFQSIEAIIKTPHRSQACIEFKSLCLRGSPQSTPNSKHSTEGSAFLKLGWSILDLPVLTLIGQDPNADNTGHLLLSIKPADGGESYGECCLSVRTLCNSGDNHFQAFLSLRGDETGSLRGKLSQISLLEVNPEKNLTTIHREPEKLMENSAHTTCSDNLLCDSTISQPSRRPARRRPASISCMTGGYSNAEYFLFEATQYPHTPTPPRPHSALMSGEQPRRTEHSVRREFVQSHAAPQTNRESRASARTAAIHN